MGLSTEWDDIILQPNFVWAIMKTNVAYSYGEFNYDGLHILVTFI